MRKPTPNERESAIEAAKRELVAIARTLGATGPLRFRRLGNGVIARDGMEAEVKEDYNALYDLALRASRPVEVLVRYEKEETK